MTLEEIIEKTNHIPSSVYEPEQEMWLKYLKDLPDNTFIVDFGTGWGKSAASLALACPQGHVFTFDKGEVYVLQKNVSSLEEYGEQVIKNLSGINNVTSAYNGGSLDTATLEVVKEQMRELGKNEIDVLNIDSDHTYESTMQEIKIWIPLVKKGGFVMFHDYEHPKAPGVGEAIHELISYKDGLNDWIDDSKPFKLEFLEKVYHPKVTTAIFKKL